MAKKKNTRSRKHPKLQLMDLVRQVADELREAQETREEGLAPVMRFYECELTASFEVEVEANGKVNLWAVEVGSTGTETATHQVTLKYSAMGNYIAVNDGHWHLPGVGPDDVIDPAGPRSGSA